MADKELRCLWARNPSLTCTDVKVEDPVQFYKALCRKSVPRRRGLRVILDIGGTGATAKFQSRTSEVPRYCVCRRIFPKVAGGAGWGRASRGVDALGEIPNVTLGKKIGNDRSPADGSGDRSWTGTILP